MRLDKELASRYQGSRPDRIDLQNHAAPTGLARWLLDGGVANRWDVYSHLLKQRAQSGGQIYLSDSVPDQRWLSSCATEWQQEGKTLGLTLLQGLSSQLAEHGARLAPDLLLDETRKRTWLLPDGEGLVVCLSCRDHSIRPWDRTAETLRCQTCRADVFRVLPTRLHAKAKEAIVKGVLLELVGAEALAAVGQAFTADNRSGPHRCGIPFEHPLAPVEVDALGEVGNTFVIIECKDLALNNTLNINTLDQTASKLKRLVDALSPATATAGYTSVRIVFLTTGRLDGVVKTKKVELAGLTCEIIDRDDLPSIADRFAALKT